LDFLLVLDYLPSPAAKRAHVFLPTLTLFETASTFVNQEGRVQSAQAVHPGGTPIEQLAGGDHPPRAFRPNIPGGEPRAAWKALAELSDAVGSPSNFESREGLWDWLVREHPSLGGAPTEQGGHSDVRASLGDGEGMVSSPGFQALAEGAPRGNEALEILLVDRTFGTEELSNYSRFTEQAEGCPALLIHAADAVRMGLRDGDRVILHLDAGELRVGLSVRENMAQGVLILPRHRLLQWQRMKALPQRVPLERIEREG